MAAATSASPGLPAERAAETATGTATATSAPMMNRAMRRRVSAERTTELLFDVPRLELDAPIEIHREAGRHMERLEKGDHDGVRTGDRKKCGDVLFAEDDSEETRLMALRSEPVGQRQQRDDQRQLGDSERRGHEQGGAAFSGADQGHAFSQL